MMRKMTIYILFNEKLEAHNEDQQFRVLISFEDLSNREEFIKKHKDLNILVNIDFIPSISTILSKKEILSYEKEKLIKQIEEDQKLHFSMLEVIEILRLNEYKNSHISYKGKNVNVGIIDDGINKNLPSLIQQTSLLDKNEKIENIKIQENEISHGTIIASIISNQFKNVDKNFIGIAPNVNLIDLRISKSNEGCYFSNILKIFDKIIEDKITIDILLLSLTAKGPSDGKDILSLACNLFVDMGLIIVSPAGNFGPESYTIGSPGAAEKVITIGALTKELTIPNFSGRGPTLDNRKKPDLCLPSSNVVVPLSHNFRVKVTGTSVSASIGAGIIALIKEYDPKISYTEIIELIKKTSLDLNYDSNAQGLGTVIVSDIFKNLDLLHDKLIPYNYLVKKSIKVTLELVILFVIIFFLFNLFRILFY